MSFLRTIVGSIVFTAAVLALVNFIGNVLVGGSATPVAGDEGRTIIQAQTESTPEPAAPATPETAVTEAAASAVATVTGGDVRAGESQFKRKCMGCHPVTPDGANRTGPNLFGIVGKAKASAEGYRYSGALERLGGDWSEAELSSFIAGPRTMVPDTKMTFAGVKKEDQRNDIIAYLRTLSN